MRIELYFGAVAPKISEQLKGQKYIFVIKDCKHWQKDADAITRLVIRRLLPDAEARKARRRLISEISKRIPGKHEGHT